MTTVQWGDIVPNAFLDNSGSDWIAVNANRIPIGRASDLAALTRACPDAAAYLQMPQPTPPEVPAEAPAEQQAEQAEQAEQQPEQPEAPSPLDHDGDGRPGGTKAKRKAKTDA